MNIVLLLAERTQSAVRLVMGIGRSEHGGIFVEVIGVDAIVTISSILFVASWIRRSIRHLSRDVLDACNSAKLSSPVNVRQTALGFRAGTCVSIIWAFSDMTLCAASTLFAIAERCKIATYVRTRVDLHVGIAAVGIRAISAQEMDACRGSIGCRVMGKIATQSYRARVSKILLANGDFVDIVRILATAPVRTRTCACVSCSLTRYEPAQ